MKIAYVGPHPAVSVPALGVQVARFDEVEVSEEDAEALLNQSTWVAVPDNPEDYPYEDPSDEDEEDNE